MQVAAPEALFGAPQSPAAAPLHPFATFRSSGYAIPDSPLAKEKREQQGDWNVLPGQMAKERTYSGTIIQLQLSEGQIISLK